MTKLLVFILLLASCATEHAPDPQPLVDPITDFDGNVYDTVRVGSQVWLSTDLKARHYADGSAVQQYSGYFYAWPTKQICPQGFRVPSASDFDILKNTVNALGVVQQLDITFRGYYDAVGIYYPDGVAYYWTTTAIDEQAAWSYQVVGTQEVVKSAYGKVHGLCIRCIKN